MKLVLIIAALLIMTDENNNGNKFNYINFLKKNKIKFIILSSIILLFIFIIIILKELESIFRTVFDDDSIQINNKTTADDIEEWDSLMHIHLMISIESKFSVKFETSEVVNLLNVGEFVDSLENKIN